MFDKDLFLYLCDKYNVELSATNTEPMVRNEDGTYDSLSDRIKKDFDDFFNEYNKKRDFSNIIVSDANKRIVKAIKDKGNQSSARKHAEEFIVK